MESQQLSSYINDQDIELAWLPSMPLINKRRAPSIAGVGILYSEDSERVFDAFETDNLARTLRITSRRQSVALANDPDCRVCWIEMPDTDSRLNILKKLGKRIDSSGKVVPIR